jgi:SAM-dependent methyltransferase
MVTVFGAERGQSGMNEHRWVETPMFMLRRDCVKCATARWRAGRFLEVGAGTGQLTRMFLECGFSGTCYDLGADNRETLRRNLSPFGAKIAVVESLAEVEPRSVDYLMAFEVLEHIDRDADALRSWVRSLKPGGRILLSVPAHMSKFNDEDRAVGHYRRYERAQLKRLLEESGCVEPEILSYGFPLAILTRRGNQCLARLKADSKTSGSTATAAAPEDLSIRSGVERSDASIRLAGILNRRTLAPFIALQRAFFQSDLGDGYVAQAVYRPAARLAAAA